jgi:hypothetical protein
MASVTVKNLKQEVDKWNQLLESIATENVQQENNIVDIIKNNDFKENEIGHIKDFQSKFIELDILIGCLRNNLAAFNKTLVKREFENSASYKAVPPKFIKLRKDIIQAEKKLELLKSAFSHYLSCS